MSNEFTKLATRHPTQYSVALGLFLFAVTAVRTSNLVFAACAGTVLFAVNWWLWRPGGLARRRMPDKGEPVQSTLMGRTFAFVAVVAVLTFLVIALLT